MFMTVVPIFLVIFVGYCFGRLNPDSGHSDKLINDYVLYIALPALLFLAIARADTSELQQWKFIVASLAGIGVTYVSGMLLAKFMGVMLPQSSILSMGACYGTTGYLGLPILISVYGESAAFPAAIATILHNIPVIIVVIITYDILSARQSGSKTSISQSFIKALKATLSNPLMISVMMGLAFVCFDIPVPEFLQLVAEFLGNATGPTALFALGLGLSRLKFKEHINGEALKLVVPMLLLKLGIQPLVTFICAYYLLGMQQTDDIWLIVAIIMAAQPIGAGVYVFANKYGFKQEVISLSIIISLLISLVTISTVLQLLPA
ncbi:putative transporter YfdV [Xenorhabdus vietnamensis]|uniref:Putative transporter YfdV n=1 Tax=Xenorhabdus vietnamensis TaxID=351656 RepID=A0A1Y2SCG5_9GAMM|nr:AEC family transporter [Xenorhabdus vietnamensis]OTA15448.1 putative transporter YfdV [Xenorhabdus vietnamensis]